MCSILENDDMHEQMAQQIFHEETLWQWIMEEQANFDLQDFDIDELQAEFLQHLQSEEDAYYENSQSGYLLCPFCQTRVW